MRITTTERFAGDAGVEEQQSKLGFFQVLKSVMSSFIGVQNNRTRERDFTHGRARDFIIIGIMLTVLFVLGVWGLVMLVMALVAK